MAIVRTKGSLKFIKNTLNVHISYNTLQYQVSDIEVIFNVKGKANIVNYR